MQNNVISSGYLNVGGGHQIYWEEWGNPEGIPVISLHGGPGSSFNESHKALFDPRQHHVIFHDQRGCGRSKPFANTENNTTQDLLHDIELLREKFNYDKVHMVGGSWGSTLSLLYAIAHPESTKSLLLWGIYLVRQLETDWINEGYPRFNFPAEWERFISLVPESKRKSGDEIMAYYADKIRSKDKKLAKKFAIEWTLWESTLLSITYDPQLTEQEVINDPDTQAVALLETHYFMNNCFISENYILDNIPKIRDIPCHVVQGRFDMCTPPIGAYDLAKSYGDKLTIEWVNSGHLRDDPIIFDRLVAAAGNLS